MKVKIVIEIETGTKEIRNAVMGAYCITQDIIKPEMFILKYDKTTLAGQAGVNKLLELVHEPFID